VNLESDIDVNTASGNIVIKKTSVLSKLEAATISGNINIDIYGAPSDYRVDARSVSGCVKVDENVSNSADRVIEVATTSGNINVSFE